MTTSNFFNGLFLSSQILKGTFTSIIVNCYIGGINRSACLLWDFAASSTIILLIHQYGKIKIS